LGINQTSKGGSNNPHPQLIYHLIKESWENQENWKGLIGGKRKLGEFGPPIMLWEANNRRPFKKS